MTDTLETPEIARIRAALAAGPTKGPWETNTAGSATRGEPFRIDEIYIYAPDVQNDTAVCADVIDPVSQEPSAENAAHIAACNPTAMATVLEHIDAQAAEIKRLRKDAERYQKLTEYLASDRTDYDELLVACSAKQSFDAVIDDMKDDAANKEAP
jgi:urease accessory protein UreH